MEVRARQTLADHLNRKHQSSQRETEDLAREKGGLQARVLVQQSQVPPAGGQSSQGGLVRARQTLADHLNRKHQSAQRETEDLAREKCSRRACSEHPGLPLKHS